MADKAELVSRTLWRLRARGSGQTPMPEDSTEVSAIIEDKLADLALRRIIYIGDPDTLPDGSMDWLSRLMEMVVAAAYGSPESAPAMLYAESMLLRQQVQEATDDHPKVCYF